MVCIYTDFNKRLLAYETVFTGTNDSASVAPREILKRALFYGAKYIIVGHNHPSFSSAEPSSADVKITSKLVDSLKLIHVDLIDHVIVTPTSTTSLAERGLM